MKNRLILISCLLGAALGTSVLAQDVAPVAEPEARSLRPAATATTLTITHGTFTDPLTFDVSVRALAAKGSPVGSIDLFERTNLLVVLPLSPMTNSPNPKFAYSDTSISVTNETGGAVAYFFFARHTIKAVFVPGTNSPATNSGGTNSPGTTYLKSSSTKTYNVEQPKYRTLTNGVKIFTIVAGSGAAIQSGQTASVLYTGFFTNGIPFDYSVRDGGAPFSFTLGAGQVIAGWDIGVLGMQVGETRIIEVPWPEGYGKTGDPQANIPPKAELIFVVTLESIS